jgi:hypothetical protein
MKFSMKQCVLRGLWKTPSWIALRLACQIAHSVTHNRVSCSCGKDWNIEKSQLLASGSCRWQTCSASSSSARAQTHLAIVQSINECLHESSAPHIPHKLDCAMCLRFSKSAVGSECLANRHKKIFTFAGTLAFQRRVQFFCSPIWSKLDAVSYSQASRRSFILDNILYADRTLKIPFLS